MEYYYRTPIDFYNVGGGFDPLDQTHPQAGDSKLTVFEYFCRDIKIKYDEGHVVLAVTVTIHPQMKYNNRLLWDASPQKQAEAIKSKIQQAVTKYQKKYRTGIKAYFFLEAHPGSGRIHAHGIMAQLNDESYYPIHIAQAMPCFTKVGFKTAGTRIEYPKSFTTWADYCKKDHGKHKLTPLYILR